MRAYTIKEDAITATIGPSMMAALFLFASPWGATAAFASDAPSWTVLIYMNADNNLEPDAIIDINEMEQVGSSQNINIVVQVDRSDRYDFSNGNWSGTKRFLISQDEDTHQITSPAYDWDSCLNSTTPACITSSEMELDMASEETLQDFLSWGIRKFPADRYAVIFWSHGNGWRADIATPVKKGLGKDNSSGNELSLKSIRSSLDTILESIQRPIDLVAFDACNMQLLEVAYELSPTATLVVGSQEEEPGGGWPYHVILDDLQAEPGQTVDSWASRIVSAYTEAHPQISVTQSALRSDKLDEVQGSLNEVSRILIAGLPENSARIRTAYNEVRKYVYPDFVDLGHLLELLSAELGEDLGTAVTTAREALGSAVVANSAVGPSVTNSNGASIYFPTSHLYDPSYEDLEFSRGSDWPRLLAEYFGTQAPHRLARLEELTSQGPEALEMDAQTYQYELSRLFAAVSRDAQAEPTAMAEQTAVTIEGIMLDVSQRSRLDQVGLAPDFESLLGTINQTRALRLNE